MITFLVLEKTTLIHDCQKRTDDISTSPQSCWWITNYIVILYVTFRVVQISDYLYLGFTTLSPTYVDVHDNMPIFNDNIFS